MRFSYKAKDSSGRIKYGKFNARDKSELVNSLRSLGLTLISSKEEGKGVREAGIKLPQFLKRVSVVDKMLFTRHLRVMLKAGLSFSRAFKVLSEQTNNNYFKEIIQSVQEDINKGNSLADSLAKYPKVFDNLFVSMIRVGETGGNLEEVLDLLAVQLKKEHELSSKVKGAMMYPAVIIFAMVVIGSLMMIFVVPSLLKVFEEMGTELPVTTRMIIAISNTLQNYGVFVFLGFVIFCVLFFRAIKTPKGKKGFDYFLLRLPVIGDVISKVNMARLSRMLSSMIASGVSIVEALEIISNTLGNVYYRDSVKKACEDVQKGVVLSEVIGQYSNLYQPLMIHMIEVGEETGTLEDTLRQVAEFYEGEVEQVTSNLSSIIEPVLMLVIGGAVGLFAVSMIQPMYSIMGSI
jgi:type IV pilus assembly protein PilC